MRFGSNVARVAAFARREIGVLSIVLAIAWMASRQDSQAEASTETTTGELFSIITGMSNSFCPSPLRSARHPPRAV